MLDSAIMGHSMVPPKSATSCRSMALDMWCRPVMTSGAYTKPNTAPKMTRNGPEMPAYTADETAEPMAQPMGPSTKWAAMTDSTRLQKGTTIIEMTAGQTLRKKRSRYTRVKAASMAGMTCAW